METGTKSGVSSGSSIWDNNLVGEGNMVCKIDPHWLRFFSMTDIKGLFVFKLGRCCALRIFAFWTKYKYLANSSYEPQRELTLCDLNDSDNYLPLLFS
jgi:hypothetical protein